MEPSLLTIYPQKNLKGCVTWALPSISTDWIGCYAKYLIFKDTSWTEILHVVAEFHSTVLHGRTVSLLLMEKNEWVCLICIEGCLSLMKIKAGFYIKIVLTIIMRPLQQGKKRNLKNKENQKTAVKRYCLPSSSSVFIFRTC